MTDINKTAAALITRERELTGQFSRGALSEKDYLQQFEVFKNDLEQQPANVQAAFCQQFQAHLENGVGNYKLLDKDTLAQLAQMLPENTSSFQWAFNKVSQTLGAKATPTIHFLATEFNKLPAKHPENPRKSVDIYLRAAQRQA